MSLNTSHFETPVNVSLNMGQLIANITAIPKQEELEYEGLYEEFEMMISMPFSGLYIAWLVVVGVIFIPGIAANSMIILALIKIYRLRVPTNFLIASLAVADLLMIAVMAAFVLSDVFQLEVPDHLAVYLWPSFDIFIGSASILNLAAVSFDRALAVRRPLQYHENLYFSQTYRAIRCVWGYSIVMLILSLLRCDIQSPAYLKAFLYTAYVCSFGAPCLVILISYSCILLSTISNLKMSRSIEKAVHSAVLNTTDNNNSNAKSKRKRRLRLQEIRIALNLMVILLPFVAGWGFYFGTHFYESIVNEYKRSDLYEWFLVIIPWFNSCVNPLIYIIFTPSLRKGCRKLICRKRNASARLRETALSSLLSKRLSTAERQAGNGIEERSSFLDRRRSRASFEHDFFDKTNGSKPEVLFLQKKTKEIAVCCCNKSSSV